MIPSWQALTHHAQRRHEWSSPRWLLYLVGVLGLAALVYGGIQQARLWRWSKMLRSARAYISQLEATREQGRYRGIQRATSRAVGQARRQEKVIERKLKALGEKQKTIRSQSQTMTLKQLKEAFDAEGF